MREINDTDLKHICLEILVQFDKLCKNFDLKYSLAYGTLLGAIRHNGFIPWDNDIDVIMPREDYEKLISLELDGDYKIVSYKNTKDYYYPFAKMINTKTYLREDFRIEKNLGVYIDIFPIDNFNFEKFNKIYKKNLRYLKFTTRYGFRFYENILKRWIKDLIRQNKNYLKSILYKFDKNVFSITDSKGNGTGCFCCPMYGKKNFFSFDIFAEGLMDIKFENYIFKIINSYDKFLIKIYGDYMQLPPEDKRVAHHCFTAEWRE